MNLCGCGKLMIQEIILNLDKKDKFMKYILLIFLCSIVISCSGKSNRIQLVGKWINLNVCMPDDFLFFLISPIIV
jgi:hypothetical protein